MNLHPLRVPEGVKVRRSTWEQPEWHYPRSGPFSTNERVGEELYIHASTTSEWAYIRDIRTPILPNFIKGPINEVRIKRKAAKIGRAVLAEHQETELRLARERARPSDEQIEEVAEQALAQDVEL